ncbi:MAG: PAS domain S-box-containing protein, partial [Candidatus Latescibacterota bacterium]
MSKGEDNALAALRQRTSKASSSEDLAAVVEAVSVYLRAKDVGFAFCGINTYRRTQGIWLTSHYMAAHDGQITTNINHPISVPRLLRLWHPEHVLYRPDLERADTFREVDYLRTSFKQPVRCVLDISFAYGTLAVNSTETHAFSEEDIDTLQQLAPILDELFAHIDGFKSLETELRASNHLRYQHALVRVRDSVWRMQSTDETYILLDAVTQALREVEIPFSDCGINVVIATEGQPKTLFYDRDNKTWHDGTPIQGSDNILSIWQSGETTYRPDLEREDPYGEQSHINEFFAGHIRSVIDIPFSRGTLAVNSTLAHAFDEEAIVFLEEMTSIMEEGFRHLQDLSLLTRHMHEAEAMSSAIAAVAATDEVDEALQTVVKQASKVLKSQRSILFLYDEDEQVLIPRAQVGHDWEALRQVRQRPGEGTSGRVFSSGESVLINNLSSQDDLPQLSPENRAHYAKAFSQTEGFHTAAAPLRIEDRIIGTLSVGGTDTAYSEYDLERLKTLASQASFALYRTEQKRVLSQSETQYRELIERTPSPIAVYADRRFTFLNPAAVRVLGGESAEQFIGHLVMDFVAPEQRSSLLRQVAAIDTGRDNSPSLIGKFIRLSGEEAHIEITGYPINDLGQPAVQVAFRDITAQICAEQILKINLALQRVRNEVLLMENEENWYQVASSIHGELRELIAFHQCGFMLIDLANDTFNAYLI